MKYLYYPGCSLEGTAREYDRATRALMTALEIPLMEIADWTCCGAGAGETFSHLLSLALPARNLALAEAMAETDQVLSPCSACYVNLKKTETVVREDPATFDTLRALLAEEGLLFQGNMHVHHLLDVLSRDVEIKKIQGLVKNPLAGWVVAPYYGCRCLRPFPVFDDPESPRSMESLIQATGAHVLPWNMGGKCCGASHMNTDPEVAEVLTDAILAAARGAHVIVTVCPMCQLNLEGYQEKLSRRRGSDLRISILYLPQLLGWALGMSVEALGMNLNLSVRNPLRLSVMKGKKEHCLTNVAETLS